MDLIFNSWGAALAARECDMEAMGLLCLNKRLQPNSGLWKRLGQLMSRRSGPTDIGQR